MLGVVYKEVFTGNVGWGGIYFNSLRKSAFVGYWVLLKLAVISIAGNEYQVWSEESTGYAYYPNPGMTKYICYKYYQDNMR